MKLNNKRTILVGLAFLSICAFWQLKVKHGDAAPEAKKGLEAFEDMDD